jgi:hypothetical protein
LLDFIELAEDVEEHSFAVLVLFLAEPRAEAPVEDRIALH